MNDLLLPIVGMLGLLWRLLHLEVYYYGFPFHADINDLKDIRLGLYSQGESGQHLHPRCIEY